MRFLRALIASGLCGTGGEAAAETRQYLCQIAQPVVSHDERTVGRQYVTYALSLGAMTPGLELRFTCHPGPGVMHKNASRDTVDSSEIENFNVANQMGMSLQVENRPRGTWNVEADTSRVEGTSAGSQFYVDRLKVVLNLKTLNEREPDTSDPNYRSTLARFNAVVAATVDCILDNATRSEPPIRKIELSVIGSPRYRHFARVYPIKAAQKRQEYRY